MAPPCVTAELGSANTGKLNGRGQALPFPVEGHTPGYTLRMNAIARITIRPAVATCEHTTSPVILCRPVCKCVCLCVRERKKEERENHQDGKWTELTAGCQVACWQSPARVNEVPPFTLQSRATLHDQQLAEGEAATFHLVQVSSQDTAA